MSLTWTIEEIEAEVRHLTGKPGTKDFTQPQMWGRINDFYQNHFPGYIDVQELESWWTATTAAADAGSYALPATIFTIEEPMTMTDSSGNVTKVDFYINKSNFYNIYPEDAHDSTSERDTPEAALLYARTVYLRPKADAVFTFKAASQIKPDALTTGTCPLNVQWGPAIAQGTAVLLHNRDQDYDAALEKNTVFQALITEINRRDLIQQHKNKRAMPRF